MRIPISSLLFAVFLLGCEDGVTPSLDTGYAPPLASELPPRSMALAERQAAADEQRMLQREAHVTVEVEDVDSAAARVRAIAQGLDGRVERFDQISGERETRQISMVVRVPEARLDDAVQRLRELGDVERLGMSAVDVTEEAQDLGVRLRNLRQLEERLLRLLSERTGDLEDVLAVERELARVRTEIESREMRLQDIERRVELATIHVTVHEPFPLRDRPSDGIFARLGGAFLQAGENVVDLVVWFIAALGYMMPLAVLAGLGYWLSRRSRRRWMEDEG